MKKMVFPEFENIGKTVFPNFSENLKMIFPVDIKYEKDGIF